jgi:hypothetical protein
MAVVAPLSRYKRNNFYIYIAVCIVGTLWCAYDGYLNETFISEHTNADGQAEWELVFNRIAPPFLAAGIALFGGWFLAVRKHQLVADDEVLSVPGKGAIPYSAIEKIDKTYFKKKGYFTIFYDRNGRAAKLALNDRQYDNLPEVLDLVAEKIT